MRAPEEKIHVAGPVGRATTRAPEHHHALAAEFDLLEHASDEQARGSDLHFLDHVPRMHTKQQREVGWFYHARPAQ